MDSKLSQIGAQLARLEDEVADLRSLASAAYESVPDGPELLERLRGSETWERAYSEPEPLISVRIATWNRAELLVERALASVLRQTYSHWEAVIVGDGCTDDTAERVTALGDPRISFYDLPRHGPYPEHRGQRWRVAGVPAMNEGLRRVQGSWIAPLDDDDEWDDDHLEVLLDEAREKKAEFVYGRLRCCLDGFELDTSIGEWPPQFGEVSLVAALYNAALREFRHDQAAWLANECHDWDLVRRMWDAGVRFAYLDRVVGTYHRDHVRQVSTERLAQVGKRRAPKANAENGGLREDHANCAIESVSSKRPPAPFVVGVGRSGTTLLRMMLDAHSTLAIPAETHFGPAVSAFHSGGVGAAVEAMVTDVLWPDYGVPAEDFVRRIGSRCPETFADVARTFYELYAERREKSRWGDKTPEYIVAMTAIQELLPEARFIHVIRDGRDVALSMAPLWFGADDAAGVARTWASSIRAARAQAPNLDFYTEVRYEDLIRDPAVVLRRLCDFVELEWEPSMLDYHRGAADRLATESPAVHVEGRWVRPEERLAIHRLVGRPPDPSRIEGWRQRMDPTELRDFERLAGDTLEELGYELGDDAAVSR